MGKIVGGVVASHSTLMNTDFDRAVDQASARAFRDALGAARSHLESLTPDVLVCIGSNHFRGFFLDLLPAFSIGVGEVLGAGEGGTPEGPLPTSPELARYLLEDLSANDFDMAFSIKMTIDHGITHAVQHLSPSPTTPIVPIVVNVFAPPFPSVRRCAQLGTAINQAVSAFPEDVRVAVIGSGGMSHNLPWPDWRSPESDDDRFLIEAWLNGRSDWQKYEQPRRSIIRGAQADISPEFDHRFLESLVRDDAGTLADEYANVELEAGNGGAELRNWIAAKAVAGSGPVNVLGYWPIDEWLTGMGVATLDAPHANRRS